MKRIITTLFGKIMKIRIRISKKVFQAEKHIFKAHNKNGYIILMPFLLPLNYFSLYNIGVLFAEFQNVKNLTFSIIVSVNGINEIYNLISTSLI